MTIAESVLKALQAAAEFNLNYEASPTCILWPDKERLWEPLVDQLRRHSPALLSLGEFDPANRRGPALWLKCALAGATDIEPHSDLTPILYLPGVGRSDFRDVESCPVEWQPLIELQYRGVIWSHVNGKDWTVSAYLSTAEGGLGLDVVKDTRTSLALQQALTKLAEVPVARLHGQQIDADFLLALLHPDPAREVLGWLNGEKLFRAGLTSDQWETFKSVCRGSYHFDPEKDGELRAAELLGRKQGAWSEVWNRFREAPQRYPEVPQWLARACPAKQMELHLADEPFDETSEPWPQVNEEAEKAIRDALGKLATLAPHETRKAILQNEALHAVRRNWVWADLGQSPMACLLKPLAELAKRSEKPMAGADLAAIAAVYDTEGWRTDDAVIQILSRALSEKDRVLADGVVRNLYLPWLEESAQNFQQSAKKQPAGLRIAASQMPSAGTILVFADALRLDLAHALIAEVRALELECELSTRWSAIPSVTATSKPAASPIAHLVGGDFVTEKAELTAFTPKITAENKTLSTDGFRRLLADVGVQYLASSETGNPEGVAWTEHGRLDADGHHDGARLALRCAEHVRILAERIEALAAVGWKSIRVVTDHGWLLVPGGLPAMSLPKFLTNTRWGRCALLADGVQSTLPLWSWTWCSAIQIASAPGVTSFSSGLEYAHGGLSLQECRIPEIRIRTSSGGALPKVKIVSVKWINLRCRVTVEGETSGVVVDLRLRPADASTSVVDVTKAPDTNGIATLMLLRDDKVGSGAAAVVVSSEGKVVHKLSLVLGEDTP